ncbi:hypothetical protein GCM10009715_42050 [Paeniglutamicibacter psychrophenolicus]
MAIRRKSRATLTALVAIGLLTSCAPARTDVSIDGITVSAELANTPERQQKGLSGRVDLLADQGMLFELGEPQNTEVWMFGVQIPLDVVWIRDGRVLRVDTLNPCVSDIESECQRTPSPGEIDTILEAGAGVFAHVQPGTRVDR